MTKPNLSDQVREYARRTYVEPARNRGETSVQVIAGDVHRALGLHNRVPLVCAALRSNKFLDANQIALSEIQGPPSQQSTTTSFRFELSPGTERRRSVAEALSEFEKYRGVAKDLFARLGGGEEFLRRERATFNKGMAERERRW